MREKTRQRILKTMPSNAIHCDATYIRLVATKMQLLNMNAAAARIETVIKEINLHWHGDLDSRGSAIYSDCAIYLSPMYVSRGILAHELCHLLDPDEFDKRFRACIGNMNRNCTICSISSTSNHLDNNAALPRRPARRARRRAALRAALSAWQPSPSRHPIQITLIYNTEFWFALLYIFL
jgi:hypothetical protein